MIAPPPSRTLSLGFTLGDSLDVLASWPPESVDAVVCDPPYGMSSVEPDPVEVLQHWANGDDYTSRGGGFMGLGWDQFVPGPAVWREVWRVMKPGAYLVAASSTRTEDLLGLSLRMAGFRRRDTIHWLYYSGFPKGVDLSKAIDRAVHKVALWDEVREHLRTWKDASGMTNKAINAAVGSSTKGGGMAAHWFGVNSQPELPTKAHWLALKAILGWDDCELDAVYDEVKGGADRPVVGQMTGAKRPHVPGGSVEDNTWDLTAAGSHEAKRWEGWNTALKPAVEPFLLFQKPGLGTLAETLLTHGTGGLAIDACRYRNGDPAWPGPYNSDEPEVHHNTEAGRNNTTIGNFRTYKVRPKAPQSDPANRRGTTASLSRNATREANQVAQAESHARLMALGWWPANVYYCPKPSRWEKEAGCEGLGPITGAQATHREEGSAGLSSPRAGAGRTAKAVRNHHPTVKPIGLMRWLVRLLTPPGGVVLDPFLGSGTTACSAELERVRWAGIEREAEYAPIIEARTRFWSARAQETGLWADPSHGKRR